jgi:hypothetical protein
VEKHCTAGEATDENTIWRTLFACWITKATNTDSEYVILIAFPRQQWLRERASILGYTYISCLVIMRIYKFYIRRFNCSVNNYHTARLVLENVKPQDGERTCHRKVVYFNRSVLETSKISKSSEVNLLRVIGFNCAVNSVL